VQLPNSVAWSTAQHRRPRGVRPFVALAVIVIVFSGTADTSQVTPARATSLREPSPKPARALSRAAIRRLSHGSQRRVIVILRDHTAGQGESATPAAMSAIQAPIMSEMRFVQASDVACLPPHQCRGRTGYECRSGTSSCRAGRPRCRSRRYSTAASVAASRGFAWWRLQRTEEPVLARL
jgi:hypothetical protein